MEVGNVKIVSFIMLIILSLYISYSDVRYRIISNLTVISVAVISVILLFANDNNKFYQHLLPIFVIGFVLFKLKWIAAGDVKLFAAFSLAISSDHLLSSLHIILLSGGVLAVFCLMYQGINRHNRSIIKGIPYGVAICIGSLFGIAASL
ncbi:MAG: prepilin peptidase [Aliivibrio sp.]|uniref:A24 family peptidase n=1 Tax=Aliivibrio sp. TaxID=1872443 RepID=UPI001A4B777D|nr:prepilin peptidase [Aliivibrio sp.]